MMKIGEQNTQILSPENMRYAHHLRYVRPDDVERLMAQGWEWTSALQDTHHGDYACLMVWPHETEPPEWQSGQR